MAETIKMRKDIPCDIRMLADTLKDVLWSELICEEPVQNSSVLLLCFEQYYFRASNYVSLSVLLSDEAGQARAVIVGSGGGDGLLNISWGANRAIAKKAQRVLEENGFYRE